jgi:hypothetical protein
MSCDPERDAGSSFDPCPQAVLLTSPEGLRMNRRFRWLAITVALAAGLPAACSAPSPSETAPAPQPAGKAYAGLVNVVAAQCSDQRKRVLPGQPSQSYLIDKMMNVDICFGSKMPKLGALPQGQITTVADWICEGAPNN